MNSSWWLNLAPASLHREYTVCWWDEKTIPQSINTHGLRVTGSKWKWKQSVSLLKAGQHHCHTAVCSPYTNTSLPCTSSHWWVLCPRWAAGRMCDTLYHTCHTPASCCLPLGSYRPEKGYCTLEQRMISDTGLGAFANKIFWPIILLTVCLQLVAS